MKGRKGHWVRQKARGKRAKVEELVSVSAKVTNPEKEEFYRICYYAAQQSLVPITPSTVLRASIQQIIAAGELAPELMTRVEVIERARAQEKERIA